jgi:hypothetical protein
VQSLAGIKNQDTVKGVNTLVADLVAVVNLALSFAQ